MKEVILLMIVLIAALIIGFYVMNLLDKAAQNGWLSYDNSQSEDD